jgi:uncharacterized protein YcbX
MNEQEFAAEMQDIFQREAGEPFPALEQFPKEILEYTSFPGMYFDVTPLHVLTTSSLAALAQNNPAANWDVRIFRPNFLIDTGSAAALWEHDWIGKQLQIGEVVIAIAGPTPRCGMTTREQDRLPFDKSILRTIVKDADQNLGAYAVVVKSGTVRADDTVTLVDTQ